MVDEIEPLDDDIVTLPRKRIQRVGRVRITAGCNKVSTLSRILFDELVTDAAVRAGYQDGTRIIGRRK